MRIYKGYSFKIISIFLSIVFLLSNIAYSEIDLSKESCLRDKIIFSDEEEHRVLCVTLASAISKSPEKFLSDPIDVIAENFKEQLESKEIEWDTDKKEENIWVYQKKESIYLEIDKEGVVRGKNKYNFARAMYEVVEVNKKNEALIKKVLIEDLGDRLDKAFFSDDFNEIRKGKSKLIAMVNPKNSEQIGYLLYNKDLKGIYIDRIYVNRESRGTGIAPLLIIECMKVDQFNSKKIRSVRVRNIPDFKYVYDLEAEEIQKRLGEWYKMLGFKPGDDENEFIYIKTEDLIKDIRDLQTQL